MLSRGSMPPRQTRVTHVVNDDYLEILQESASSAPAPSAAEREILRAAVETFGLRGYTGSSVRLIAERAGVTAPLIGYHFGSKEGLFTRCVEVVLGGINQLILREVAEDDGIEDAVRRLARAFFDVARRRPEVLRFGLSVIYGPEHGQPPVDWLHHYAGLWTWAAERFGRAVDEGELVPRSGAQPGVLARHLMQTVHMEVLGIYERDRYADQLRSFVKQTQSPEAVPGDPVEGLVTQFFRGAGKIQSPPEEESRSS